MWFQRKKKILNMSRKEKIVKLHFYVQDLRVGNPNPTVYEVATTAATATSPTNFGSIHVLDDLLTAGPEYESRPLGRVQGLTTSSDLSENAVAMNLNFYFTTGRYKGSTISILGRNPVAEERRELPVVGGTGAFRFARGYAFTSNKFNDGEKSYSVLEYTMYVACKDTLDIHADDHDIEIVDL